MKPDLEICLYSKGVLPHYKGYTYLLQAAYRVAEEPRRIQNLHRDIYEPIAAENNTTVIRVIKNLRTVRDIFWKNGGDQFFQDKTRCEAWKYQKPYPREFIEVLASCLEEKE